MAYYREWTTDVDRWMTPDEAEAVAATIGEELLVKGRTDPDRGKAPYSIRGLHIQALAELVAMDIIDPMLFQAANDTVLFRADEAVDVGRARAMDEWREELGEAFVRRAHFEDVKSPGGTVYGVWMTAAGLHMAGMAAAHWEAKHNAKEGT